MTHLDLGQRFTPKEKRELTVHEKIERKNRFEIL